MDDNSGARNVMLDILRDPAWGLHRHCRQKVLKSWRLKVMAYIHHMTEEVQERADTRFMEEVKEVLVSSKSDADADLLVKPNYTIPAWK